jgi:hypothetical protein
MGLWFVYMYFIHWCADLTLCPKNSLETLNLQTSIQGLHSHLRYILCWSFIQGRPCPTMHSSKASHMASFFSSPVVSLCDHVVFVVC